MVVGTRARHLAHISLDLATYGGNFPWVMNTLALGHGLRELILSGWLIPGDTSVLPIQGITCLRSLLVTPPLPPSHDLQADSVTAHKTTKRILVFVNIEAV